jgi:integrase
VWGFKGRSRTERRLYSEEEATAVSDAIWTAYQLGDADALEAKPPQTLSQLFERFVSRPNLRPSTIRGYKQTLQIFVSFIGPNRLIKNISSHDIRRYTASFDASLAGASKATYLRYVKALFGFAVKREWVKLNPAANVSVRVARKPVQYLPFSLWDSFLSACSPTHKIRCQFILYTGVRSGELLHAKWDWIEEAPGGGLVLNITADEQADWMPKSGSSRQIPLSDAAVSALDAARSRWGRGDYIFSDHLLTAWNSHRETKRACLAIGIKPIKTHALRASFATHLHSLGVDVLTISRLLGHSGIDVLVRHYAGFSNTAARASIALLDSSSTPF